MNEILARVRGDLAAAADEKTRISGLRYFKESVTLYGVRAAKVTDIGREHFRSLRGLPKSDIFSLCEQLWKSGYMEETFIACIWSHNLHRQYQPEDFNVFERWVENYVNNWASCDTLCNHTVGDFVQMYPQFLGSLKKWALSENRWTRRASAVSLIVPARKGKFLDDIFAIATLLLTDSDDMVRKGYGWMLKAASQAHLEDVFEYVMKNKHNMPRTSLRYAIEKMPSEMKQMAMRR